MTCPVGLLLKGEEEQEHVGYLSDDRCRCIPEFVFST